MSKFKKGAVSIVLAVSILITFVCSFGGVTATASSSLNSQGLASNVQDGVILHAWNWSYNTIKNNMANIAAAGIQRCKPHRYKNRRITAPLGRR